MNRRVRIVVTGRVQGVGFRAATAEAAADMDVCGWVANRSDGTVEIVAQARERQLEQFIGWCRRGPRWARVEAIDVEDRACGSEFVGFAIRHGSL